MMADYTFDHRSGRYRGEDGRFVPEKTIRDALDRVADEASSRLTGLSERLRDGHITVDVWQREAMAVVKDAHLAAGIAAHGGTAAMDAQTYGYIGRQIRGEYGYFHRFAQDVANGTQALTGIAGRAQQYGQAARSTFESVRARDDLLRGMDEERNVLSLAEHCAQCLDLSARGWVAIGTLPPIGSRQCRSNDRCSIRRRAVRSQADADAA